MTTSNTINARADRLVDAAIRKMNNDPTVKPLAAVQGFGESAAVRALAVEILVHEFGYDR